MPLYNKAATVERSIISVLGQAHDALELIIVDDGSSDSSANIVRRVHDSRLTLLQQSNAGPGAARNRAWRESTGQLVAFLDADDYWDSDFLTRALAAYAQHPRVQVYTGGHRSVTHAGIVPGNLEWPGKTIRPGLFSVTPRTPVRELLARLTYMFPVTTVVRRHVLERDGGFFERDRCTYGEDSFFWAKVILNSPCYMEVEPSMTVDRTASDLSTLNSLGSRPLEPLLRYPDELREACPVELRPLAERLLALKAYKRSCTLAATGRRAEARALRDRFKQPGRFMSFYGVASLVATTSPGAWLSSQAIRALRRIRRE